MRHGTVCSSIVAMVTRRHTVYRNHQNALLNTILGRIVSAALSGWTSQRRTHLCGLNGQIGCIRDRCMDGGFSIYAAA